jgi:ribonucleotide reductase alpha subunit
MTKIIDIKDNEGYLQLCAIMQKFVDQAISANTHYDPSLFKGNKVPMKLFLMDYFLDMMTSYNLHTPSAQALSSSFSATPSSPLPSRVV